MNVTTHTSLHAKGVKYESFYTENRDVIFYLMYNVATLLQCYGMRLQHLDRSFEGEKVMASVVHLLQHAEEDMPVNHTDNTEWAKYLIEILQSADMRDVAIDVKETGDMLQKCLWQDPDLSTREIFVRLVKFQKTKLATSS